MEMCEGCQKLTAEHSATAEKCDTNEKNIDILSERQRQTDKTMNKLSTAHTSACNDRHEASLKQSTYQLRWVVSVLITVIGGAFWYMSSIKEVVIRIDKTVVENKLAIKYNKDGLKKANGHRYYLNKDGKN